MASKRTAYAYAAELVRRVGASCRQNKRGARPWFERDKKFWEILPIYKAICRHIWRRLLTKHRRCILSAARRIWWHIEGQKQPAICPKAYAFLTVAPVLGGHWPSCAQVTRRPIGLPPAREERNIRFSCALNASQPLAISNAYRRQAGTSDGISISCSIWNLRSPLKALRTASVSPLLSRSEPPMLACSPIVA